MKLYSIGEVSKLNNITIKTLRYYDKIGLLEPAYIDETNGYRYYSYSQFIIIDKIKKFKYWNIPLNELKDIIYDEEGTKLKNFFRKRREYLDSETKRLQMSRKYLDMLEEHFIYFDIVKMNKNVYVRHIKERHYISLPCQNIDNIFEIDIELRRIISSPQLTNVLVINPYGYIFDCENFLNNKLTFLQSIVTLGELPSIESEYLYTAPEGIYVCFSSNILSDENDITPLTNYIKQNNLNPQLIVAEEFILNGIHKFENCPYEIQVLVSEI